ncbi:MAG: hypothetical protein ACFCUM_18490 [Bacteroidales bacterium]
MEPKKLSLEEMDKVEGRAYLSLNEMEDIEGGAYIDCVLMVAGFAGAVAAKATLVGIGFGLLSFAGGVRSAQACEGSTSWF